MNLHFSFTGTQDIHTVSKISVQKQQNITIPCLYDQKYVSFPKYMSCGGVWIFSKHISHNRMSVEDNQAQNVFTATLSEAEVSDSGTYWCAVTVSGSDPHVYLDLQVTEGIMYSEQIYKPIQLLPSYIPEFVNDFVSDLFSQMSS